MPRELEELEVKHAKGRASKAADDRLRAMASIRTRMEWLHEPREFVYNPNGNNFGAASLSHSEVIKLTAYFLKEKPSMQEALIGRYPFLLIDESQDTNRDLLEALFFLEKEKTGRFAIGLFGDTMQRIYADGSPQLGRTIPANWSTPQKKMNHRSGQRIVALANALREDVDGRSQFARDDSIEGHVRVFIYNSTVVDKMGKERAARERMATITGDEAWCLQNKVKTLALEHHMAASRQGFLPMFSALDKGTLSTGLRAGDLAGLRLFTQCVMPLHAAYKSGDKFATLNILRSTKSPLLEEAQLDDSEDPLKFARQAVEELGALLEQDVTFLSVLECIARRNLFEVPNALRPFTIDPDFNSEEGNNEQDEDADSEEESEDPDGTGATASLSAWRAFLETSYRQIIPYSDYLSTDGAFGTHQGVKGLQFDRVLVIIDDDEAKGFLFSYGKVWGSKPMTSNDLQRKMQGEETGEDRTRRLLYVTCTRAKEGLAIVIYDSAPALLAQSLVKRGWFDECEIEVSI